MAEEIDLAGLLRPGDRLAWSAGPVEPTHLLGMLDRQLDCAPPVSVLLNVSFQTALDAARLASRATVTALGGAVTNRRFQEIGALDVLPINYSAMPDLWPADGGRSTSSCCSWPPMVVPSTSR